MQVYGKQATRLYTIDFYEVIGNCLGTQVHTNNKGSRYNNNRQQQIARQVYQTATHAGRGLVTASISHWYVACGAPPCILSYLAITGHKTLVAC